MANPQNSSRNAAVHLLQHYLRTIGIKAGVKWDRDLDLEVEECVDHIIDAAVEQVREDNSVAVQRAIKELLG